MQRWTLYVPHQRRRKNDLTKYIQMQSILKTPIPKVLAWNSKPHENPVGAEYIIMEKAPGIELEYVWPSLDIKDRLVIVKTIATFQKAWTSVSFKKFGSLYYKSDLKEVVQDGTLYTNADGNDIMDENFAIGPSTGREMIDNGRRAVNFDRGPCKIAAFRYHLARLTVVRELIRRLSYRDWSSRDSLCLSYQ